MKYICLKAISKLSWPKQVIKSAPKSVHIGHPLRIGPYQFHRDDNSVVHENKTRPVQPKIVQLVGLLVENQGTVVTRETIEACLWPGCLVGLDSVNNTVSRLRKTVCDNPKTPLYIETIPRIGYRLKPNASQFPPDIPVQELGILSRLNPKRTLIPIVTAIVIAIGVFYQQSSKPQLLHRDPQMQHDMLAKYTTVNQLLTEFDIILKPKDEK